MISPACTTGHHDHCFHIGNPTAPRRQWTGCACECHVAQW